VLSTFIPAEFCPPIQLKSANMADSTSNPLTVPSGGVTGTTEEVQVPATTTLPIRSNKQSMEPEQRLALIRENLAELLDPEIIENIIKEGKNPKIYWGTLNSHG
jgi:tyrosyl-tRNA synthetase